jgi:hypothetical protein
MDLSTCPTATAPEPRAARPAWPALSHRRQPPAVPARRELARGSTWRIEARAGQTLRVLRGRVWATLSGWPEDRWLDAGQSWTLPAGGRLVIEGSGHCLAEIHG